MKLDVLDIQRYKFLLIILLFPCFGLVGQTKNEKESRVSSDDIPENIHVLLSEHISDAKRVRYYREIDGKKKSFEVKFKKQKLHYSVEFNESGMLEDVEFKIKPDDIPNENWNSIQRYLQQNFPKFTIKKIQQQHPVSVKSPQQTLVEAFQNLILPHINYEVVFSAKKEGSYQIYEGLFDATGKLLNLRKSLPTEYDHVLY